MAKDHTTLTQTVKLYPEDDLQAVQRVTVDVNDQWIIVGHSGEEISLSLENWKKLNELVKKTMAKANGKSRNTN